MKKIYIFLACLWAITSQAQNFGSPAMRKLQMAEFAIANLYVDKVDENKLVEEAITKCWHNSIHTPPIRMRKRIKKMNEPLQGNF